MTHCLCIAATLLLALGAAQASYIGAGTAYSGHGEKDATGFNACQFRGIGGRWERHYAALPEEQFESGHCGKCAKVCGTRGCVVVKVVDACASCSEGDIDLSTAALKKASGFSWDRTSVSWSFCGCGEGDDAEPEQQEARLRRRRKVRGRHGHKREKQAKKYGRKHDGDTAALQRAQTQLAPASSP